MHTICQFVKFSLSTFTAYLFFLLIYYVWVQWEKEPPETLSSFWLYQWVQLWQMGAAGGARALWLPLISQISHWFSFTVLLASKINLELSGKEASFFAFLKVCLKSQYFHSLFSMLRQIFSARSGEKTLQLWALKGASNKERAIFKLWITENTILIPFIRLSLFIFSFSKLMSVFLAYTTFLPHLALKSNIYDMIICTIWWDCHQSLGII